MPQVYLSLYLCVKWYKNVKQTTLVSLTLVFHITCEGDLQVAPEINCLKNTWKHVSSNILTHSFYNRFLNIFITHISTVLHKHEIYCSIQRVNLFWKRLWFSPTFHKHWILFHWKIVDYTLLVMKSNSVMNLLISNEL